MNDMLIIKKLWNNFMNVPVNDKGCIAEDFYIFAKGTSKQDVLNWFDAHCSKGIKYLLNLGV